MDFSFQDGIKLWSLLRNKDDLLQKKRRWLMKSESNADGGQKRFKRPKFMKDMYVPESYNDDEVLASVKPVAKVSKETIRSTVVRSFGSLSNERRCFMVQDYILPLGMPDMRLRSVNRAKFSSRFLSMMDNLNDDALSTVAHIVTNNKVSLRRSRAKIKKVIKHHFPQFLEEQQDISSSLEQLSDILRRPSSFLEINSLNLQKYPNSFLSMMGNLNDDAFSNVACIITNKKASFQKNRTKMKKVIKEHFPLFLRENRDASSSFEQLIDILRKPGNFREKHLKIGTPVSEALLSSMSKILERLHEMSFQELNAINRKLRGVSVVPQFLRGRDTCRKDLILERVKRRCKKILDSLKEGDYLPKPFAKALSVMHLVMKYRLHTTDIPESGFFPFSPEVVRLQNDIIRALWSFSKMKHKRMKAFHDAIDPNARVPTKTFRNALRKYLIEYLFECHEVKPPKEVVAALEILNRRSQFPIPMLSEEAREEEVEAVMSFSCQLRKFVVSEYPNIIEDECGDVAELESDEGGKSDAFDLSASDYFSLGGCENSYYESGSNFEVQCSQDSRSAASTSSSAMGTNSYDLADSSICINVDKNNKNELDDDYDDDGTVNLCHKEPMNESHQNKESKTEISVTDLSNETALVAYRVVGRMLDKLIITEDANADFRTRSYLNGGSLPSHEIQAPGGFSSASNGDKEGQILLETIHELLPVLPKRCLQSVHSLMKESNQRAAQKRRG